jgi:hypothetical protein
MSALDRMPDSWWISYGHDVDCGVAGDACALLRHIIEEEQEIDMLIASGRMVTS